VDGTAPNTLSQKKFPMHFAKQLAASISGKMKIPPDMPRV
jgi:hypothetical protein